MNMYVMVGNQLISSWDVLGQNSSCSNPTASHGETAKAYGDTTKTYGGSGKRTVTHQGSVVWQYYDIYQNSRLVTTYVCLCGVWEIVQNSGVTQTWESRENYRMNP